jgi:hypothetical protein
VKKTPGAPMRGPDVNKDPRAPGRSDRGRGRSQVLLGEELVVNLDHRSSWVGRSQSRCSWRDHGRGVHGEGDGDARKKRSGCAIQFSN